MRIGKLSVQALVFSALILATANVSWATDEFVVIVNAGNDSASAPLDGVTIGDRLWGEGSSSGSNLVSVPGRRATIWSMTR